MRALLKRKSGNVKTGPIAVTYSSSESCPDACGLKETGCYAKTSYLVAHWRKLDAGERGIPYADFLAELAELPAGTVLRHNVYGDLPGDNNAIDPGAMRALTLRMSRLRAWTYTHKPVTKVQAWKFHVQPKTLSDNAREVASANRFGFTVNLSADDTAKADALADLQIAPVVTILPIDAPKVTRTPAGRKIVTCPATWSEKTTCANCGGDRPLCQRAERDYIVGFPAHGYAHRHVDKIARRLPVIQERLAGIS